MKGKKTIRIMTALLLAMTLIQGCGKSENSASSNSGYVLTVKETALMDKLLRDEQAAFIQGRKSILFGNAMPFVTAFDVAKEYDENQVSADQKFFKKKLQITGIIESINSGIGNVPYVSLRGTNQFLSPQAHFTDGNVEKIASLKKGQSLSLLCEGGGAVIGAPMFTKCVFAADYAAVKASDAKMKGHKFLRGEAAKSDVIPKLTLASIAIARILPSESACFIDGSTCNSELETINNETLNKKMTEVAIELKSLGVPVPDLLVK